MRDKGRYGFLEEVGFIIVDIGVIIEFMLVMVYIAYLGDHVIVKLSSAKVDVVFLLDKT